MALQRTLKTYTGNSQPTTGPPSPPISDGQGSCKTPTIYPHKHTLPAWALAALEQEQERKLVQPWKAKFTGADDPNFTQGKDTVMFYDERVKVCYGEGSMAA